MKVIVRHSSLLLFLVNLLMGLPVNRRIVRHIPAPGSASEPSRLGHQR
jgi:hypothetical protein